MRRLRRSSSSSRIICNRQGLNPPRVPFWSTGGVLPGKRKAGAGPPSALCRAYRARERRNPNETHAHQAMRLRRNRGAAAWNLETSGSTAGRQLPHRRTDALGRPHRRRTPVGGRVRYGRPVCHPGLIDIHFHGCAGHDLCEGTHAALSAMARYQAQSGICAICPATVALPEAELASIMESAASYTTEPLRRGARGPQSGGAVPCGKPPTARRMPRISRRRTRRCSPFAGKAQGLIRLCEIAPELPGALDLISELAGEVRLSLAHTDAGLRDRLRGVPPRRARGHPPVQRHGAHDAPRARPDRRGAGQRPGRRGADHGRAQCIRPRCGRRSRCLKTASC